MRVLVCGGQRYRLPERVHFVLDALQRETAIDCIIEGGAAGADHYAAGWAATRGIEIHEFKADWARHGRAAGPMRNRAMLVRGQPDVVVAFPGGAGTANMLQQAGATGIRIIEVDR